MPKLTDMQRKLVNAHLLCGDLDQAATEAGSKCATQKSRREWACQSLAKPHVEAYYKECLAKRRVLYEVRAETFFKALSDIATNIEHAPMTRIEACTAALDRMGHGVIDRSEIEMRAAEGAVPVDATEVVEQLRVRMKNLPPAVVARMKSGLNGANGNGSSK